MKIISVEDLSVKASMRLRREARRARRERSAYLASCNPLDLLQADISAHKAQISSYYKDTELGKPQSAPVANELRSYNEEEDDSIALLRFAREKEKPVLVEFSWEPSKASEGRLRQSAKRLNCKVRFFRLIGG